MYLIFRLMLGSFLVIGLLVTGYGALSAWRDYASTGWPQVSGQVVQASLGEIENLEAGGSSSYKPVIEYRYVVSGQTLVGKRVSFAVDAGLGGGNAASRYLEKYPVGKEVVVHYQPDQPALSVLEPGLTARSFIRLAFGLVFVVFPAVFLFVLRRLARQAAAGAGDVPVASRSGGTGYS